MEESFRVRVDKTFGPLSSQSKSSIQPINSSLWSLTDDDLQPNRWTRESDDPPSDDDNDTDVDKVQINHALNDASFTRDVDKFFTGVAANPNPNFEIRDDCIPGQVNVDDDELEVRKSVGLDSTLDFEEEEDEYDKVAVGKEKPEDRLYVSDVSDYVSESCNEVPNTFHEAPRDPRANHVAAKLRLKEDAETARDFNSLHVSEQSLAAETVGQISTHDGDINLKSILKRKEDQMDSKSEKRVRFDPSCKNSDGDEHEVDEDLTLENASKKVALHDGASSQMKQTSLIPDYVRNPSKYKHYTFDTSSDMNEASNRQAYADFLSILRKSKQTEPEEVPADLSKPVIFNPNKKTRDARVACNEADCTMDEPVDRKRSGITVAVVSDLEDQSCEMEVDEQATPTLKTESVKKTGRRYRSKPSLQYDESEA